MRSLGRVVRIRVGVRFQSYVVNTSSMVTSGKKTLKFGRNGTRLNQAKGRQRQFPAFSSNHQGSYCTHKTKGPYLDRMGMDQLKM